MKQQLLNLIIFLFISNTSFAQNTQHGKPVLKILKQQQQRVLIIIIANTGELNMKGE